MTGQRLLYIYEYYWQGVLNKMYKKWHWKGWHFFIFCAASLLIHRR